MTVTTAYFLGGPWDGSVRHLSSARPRVEVWEYHSDFDKAREPGSDLADAISVEVRWYRREPVTVLGQATYVWVYEDTATAEALSLLAERVTHPAFARFPWPVPAAGDDRDPYSIQWGEIRAA